MFKVGEVFDLNNFERGESLFKLLVLGIGASEENFALGKFELVELVVEGVTGGIEGDGNQTGAPGGVI